MERLRCGFSHPYDKLHGQTRARLLEVAQIKRKDIEYEAVMYDTRYVYTDEFGKEHVNYFDLDFLDDYLRLTFIGNIGIPFTTYRTNTPEHFKKYFYNVGNVFEIYVKEDK